MAIVTTGQVTIVDQNDARPITAFLGISPGAQQTYTKEDTTEAYSPDWTTENSDSGLRIRARVFVGGSGAANEVTGQLTNRKFMLVEDGTAIPAGAPTLISSNAEMAAAFESGAGKTFSVTHDTTMSRMFIKANMLPTVQNQTVYFEGDYTDPTTSLTVKVMCQVTLSLVRTGTNATYVLTSGRKAIKKSTGATKNVAVVKANLVRPSGIDTSGLEFRWFYNNGTTQISTSTGKSGGTTGTQWFTLKNIAEGAAVTGSVTDLGTVNLPAAGAWTSLASGGNTLVIHEDAVVDIGMFRVEVRDTANSSAVYSDTFTVTDLTDPFRLELISSTGDKFNNGEGTSSITPKLYSGGVKVTNLTGWEFIWTPYNRTGKRAAFIDASRTPYGSGRDITAHTTGTAATFTYSGGTFTTPAIVAGDIIKVVSPSGQEAYYEVASVAGNVVTIRTPTTNTWLTFADYPSPTANQFLNGKFYVCTLASGNATRGQRVTSGGAAITLTGDEVDGKMTILVTGDRP